jgi:hypothetical protein
MAKASRWIKTFQLFTEGVRIKSKESTARDDAGVPLNLWESQRRYLTQLGEGLDDGIHKFVWLKSRQLGITTISLLLDVFWVALHKHLEGAIITEHEGNRDKNRDLIRHYINSFPPGYFGDDFYIMKGKDNNKSMGFSNGASLRFLVAGTKKKSIAWAEGSGYALIHGTEVASYYGAEGLASLEEAFPQSNPDRLLIYESTAKGTNNVFHDRWKLAEEDPYTWRSNFIGWWANPHNGVSRGDARFAVYGKTPRTKDERDWIAEVQKLYDYEVTPEQLCWYRWRYATSQGEERSLFFQNQPSTARDAFVESGYSFFPIRKINKVLLDMREDESGDYDFSCYQYDYGDDFFQLKLRYFNPADHGGSYEQIESQVELKVWQEPKANGRYVIGMDPSYATEHGDYSVVSVWRCYADCIEQVAEYATNKIEPVRTAWVLAHLAGAYRDCLINLELDGGGTNVMQELDSLKGRLRSDMYRDNVRSEDWADALGWARWYLFHRPDSMGAGYMMNYKANYSTKHTMMYGFQGSFATNQLVIRSERLLFDMQNVRVDGNSIAAPDSPSEDCKDDRVIAGALAHKAWSDWRRNEMIAEGLTRERVKNEADLDPRNPAHRHAVKVQQVNGLVYRFMQSQQQRAEQAELDGVPTWRTQRGL